MKEKLIIMRKWSMLHIDTQLNILQSFKLLIDRDIKIEKKCLLRGVTYITESTYIA